MKKVISIMMSVLIISAMCISAYAVSPITSKGGTDSATVSGLYKSGSSADTVYDIDITWGSLEFTYTGAGKGTWNPGTHTYSGGAAATWSCDTEADKITVVNHSNAAVNATLSYAAKTGYTAITGSFTESSGTANDGVLALPTAVGTTVNNAPAATARLVLSGALAKGVSNQTIGTVTVSLD